MTEETPDAGETDAAPLSDTARVFAALPPNEQTRVVSRLDTLSRTGSESRVRPAIAYFLSEFRGAEGVSYPEFLNHIRTHAIRVGASSAIGPGPRNLNHFLNRFTGDPSGPMVSCCALYAIHLLETRPELDDHIGFAHQRRILEWVKAVLRGDHTQPVPSEPDVDPDATLALSSAADVMQVLKTFLDNRIRNGLSNDAMRESLHLDADTHQVGYLCFRSAFNRSFRTVQSYLALLAPERNRTPFWTFSLFSEGSDTKRVRIAGGIALATQSTLYLLGGEGAALNSELHDGQSVYSNLKASNFVAFAVPIEEFSDTHRIVPGIALTANGDGTPVVGRIALRRVDARVHDGLVGLVELDQLGRAGFRLRPDGADPAASAAEDGDDAPLTDPAPGGPAPSEEEIRQILSAINNNAAYEFFDAVEKESGKPRKSAYFKDRISSLFKSDGEALFEASEGEDYSFDKHRWTHVLGRWRKAPD